MPGYWDLVQVNGESASTQTFAEAVVRAQGAYEQGKLTRVLVGSGHGPANEWEWKPEDPDAIEKLTRAFNYFRQFAEIKTPRGAVVPVRVPVWVNVLHACYALASQPFRNWWSRGDVSRFEPSCIFIKDGIILGFLSHISSAYCISIAGQFLPELIEHSVKASLHIL